MGAKPCSTLFFTLHRKRGCRGGLGGTRCGVGAKRGRSRGGCVGAALTQRDGARYHFDGIGKMVTKRFKLDQLSRPKLDQCRRVAPGLDFRPRGFRDFLPCCATYE